MKTIVWDIDDVLNSLTYEWLVFYNSSNRTNHGYSMLKENPPDKLLNISLDKYLSSLDEFRKLYFSVLNVNIDIYNWFLNNGSDFRNIALSAVPYKFSNISAEWLIRHYGKWIRTFSFIPSKRKNINIPEYDKTKAEVMIRLGHIDLFIDDNEMNINKAKEAGITAILFPRPWNSNRNKNISWFISELNSRLI